MKIVLSTVCLLLLFTQESFAKYNDSDWNVTMFQQCSKDYRHFKMLEEDGNKFVRVSLDEKSMVGSCRDKFRQRAELSTRERMKPGSTWEYSTDIRFNNKLIGEAIFMQIHAKTGSCTKVNGRTTKPPLKLRMIRDMNAIILEPGTDKKGVHWTKVIETPGMFKVGEWTNVKIVIDLQIGSSTLDLYIGGNKVVSGFKTGTPNSCIKPWGKIGIYRQPYQVNNEDRWKKTKDPRYGNPWLPIAVDYDNILLRKLK